MVLQLLDTFRNACVSRCFAKPHHCLLLFATIVCVSMAQAQNATPVRLAVAGITHGHVPLILDRKGKNDIEIVGVYEPNTELAQRYAKKYHFDPALIYTDLAKMLDAVKPQGVAAFG